MSWFRFGNADPRYPRSLSERFRLPKGQSSTSVAKSTISAPVLTSTTNTEVAQSEDVHYGELTQESLSKSTWNGKLGWVSMEDEHRTAAAQARELAERFQVEDRFQLKPSARLQKVADAVQDRFRRDKSRDQMAFRAIPYSTFDGMTETASRQKMTSSKAETTNLCKNKIRALTGQAECHRRSYSTGFLTTTSKPGAEHKDPPLLHHGDNKSSISSAALSETSDFHHHHFYNHEQSSQVGSFTRTFNSALDTETSNMDFIRTQAAKLGIRSKREKEQAKAHDKFKKTISGPLPGHAQLTTDHFDKNNPVVPKWQAIPPPTQTTDTAKMLAAMPKPDQPTPVNEQDSPEWARLPVPDGYVSSPASPTKEKVTAPEVRRARVEQDDQINPVGMYADVKAFAEAPAAVRLPDPRLPDPKQLKLTGEYPQEEKKKRKKRESMLDMMQFLGETEEEERKKEKEKEAEEEEEAKKAAAEAENKKKKKSLGKSISRVFTRD